MGLLLCVSQQENTQPYRFSVTGIQAYTFEEILYHVYNYWKQSVDDVTSPHLVAWVHDTLGLPFVAAKIKQAAAIENFSERMLAFLRTSEYFDEPQLAAIRPNFERWEKRLEWETYKERADDLAKRGEPEKAIPLYRRALQYDENVPVFNNLGAAYMQIDLHNEAADAFARALQLDADNWQLVLNYGEALIAAGRLDDGKRAINRATAIAPKSAIGDILYLRAELSLKLGQSPNAISYFEQAIAVSSEAHYVFRLADTYALQRQFDKALDTLGKFNAKLTKSGKSSKNEQILFCYMKEAEIHALADNRRGAILAIKKATQIRPGNEELWIRLAKYYRLNYDLPSAEDAIRKALDLDGGNHRARLENARIQKSMGDIKAYQQLLKGILGEFKARYRDVYG